METLIHKMEREFDPTDADASQQLAYAALKLAKWALHAVWAYDHNLAMGRDVSSELSVSAMEVGRKLRLLPYGYSGKDAATFQHELTGLE